MLLVSRYGWCCECNKPALASVLSVYTVIISGHSHIFFFRIMSMLWIYPSHNYQKYEQKYKQKSDCYRTEIVNIVCEYCKLHSFIFCSNRYVCSYLDNLFSLSSSCHYQHEVNSRCIYYENYVHLTLIINDWFKSWASL